VFHTYVASVSSGCCMCLAMIFKCFQVFTRVFQTLVSNVSSVFFCMLQLLHVNVSKVDRVLHIGCMREVAGGTSDLWAVWVMSGAARACYWDAC
jgi:hypothetical protein